MTKKELIEKLKNISGVDPEADHSKADKLLLKFINDNEVTIAFEKIRKWYA